MYVKTFRKDADLQKHLLSVCVLVPLREKGNTDLMRCVVVLLHFKATEFLRKQMTLISKRYQTGKLVLAKAGTSLVFMICFHHLKRQTLQTISAVKGMEVRSIVLGQGGLACVWQQQWLTETVRDLDRWEPKVAGERAYEGQLIACALSVAQQLYA